MRSLKSLFNLRHAAIIAAAFFVFGLSNFCFALGLSVDPGSISVENVPLVRKGAARSPLGYAKFKITNNSDEAYTFTIAILPVAKTTSPLTPGYKDIPDIAWVKPKQKELRISAHDTREAELFIMVPDNPEFSDKKYMAVLEVKSKKNNKAEMFVVACQAQIWITTGKYEEHKKKGKK